MSAEAVFVWVWRALVLLALFMIAFEISLLRWQQRRTSKHLGIWPPDSSHLE